MKLFIIQTLVFLLCTIVQLPSQAKPSIRMMDAERLARLEVEEILPETLVESIFLDNYWQSIGGKNRPVVVLFYMNQDKASQNVASIIRYLAEDYSDKVQFYKVMVNEQGILRSDEASELLEKYELNLVPGILFYDNVNGELVLEYKEYASPTFDEFESPEWYLWQLYNKVARKEIRKILAD